MAGEAGKPLSYPRLFSEGRIGRLTLRNRIVMAPMAVFMANLDGTPSEQLIDYYEERARSGVALIVTGICRVNDVTGAAGPRQIALSRDIHIPAFARAARRVQRHGTKLVAQLHHPGRQNLSLMMYGWPLVQRIGALYPELVYRIFESQAERAQKLVERYGGPAVAGPSAVPCGHVRQRTRALAGFEIRGLVTDFIRAARRAQLAGLDGVMLHAAHGYLIQQFLSTRTNKRNDAYGGSLENRLRFLREIVRGIREACGPDFPLLVRLTVDEFYRCIGKRTAGSSWKKGCAWPGHWSRRAFMPSMCRPARMKP
jgi:2,4-dienoyl-CoA reductase-like NADH-dependent reductase (Old Yellow Enzyme family)